MLYDSALQAFFRGTPFYQRWRRGHKARSRGQEHKEIRGQGHPFRGQTLSRPRTQAQVFSKKKVLKKFFQAISKRGKQKRSSQIFREVSGNVQHNFKNEQIPTIVGTDANSHRTIWGSSDINPQGEDLLAYCVTAHLNFCIVANKPTFRTKTREEVLDLILVNRCAWDR